MRNSESVNENRRRVTGKGRWGKHVLTETLKAEVVPQP